MSRVRRTVYSSREGRAQIALSRLRPVPTFLKRAWRPVAGRATSDVPASGIAPFDGFVSEEILISTVEIGGREDLLIWRLPSDVLSWFSPKWRSSVSPLV